jgi:hypothetical protein
MTLLSLSDKDRETASLAESLQAKSVHALLEGWAQIEDPVMRTAILDVVGVHPLSGTRGSVD